jgi:O-antigen/teichoic acid export membrane protein
LLPALRDEQTELNRTDLAVVSIEKSSLLSARTKLNFTTEAGQISRQSAVVFAGTMFSAVLGYLFKIYLARALGSEALGLYTLGMTVVGFVGIFGGMGLTWAASRFPAAYLSTGRLEDLRVFIAWSLLILVGIDGLLAECVVLITPWVSVNLYHTPALVHYSRLLALILFLGALTAFFGQLLSGYKEVAKRTIITNFAGVALTILFTVVLVTLRTGLWGYMFAQVASAIVVAVLLIWSVHKFTPPAARFTFKRLHRPPGQIFSFAAAAFAMDIVGFLYGQADKIILGFYLNARSVGVYAVAATVVAFVPIALQSLNQIFAPTIADFHARGEMELLSRLFQTSTKWVTALTFPLAIVVMIFSRVLMRIFGHDF